MKHLAVGVFHNDKVAHELGKKDTESDIVLLNRKTGEQIFTFMYPLEDKLSAKSQIISSIDAAIVAFNGSSRELGETVVMLDSLGVSHGIAITSPYATPDQIAAITRHTSLESFTIGNMDSMKMLGFLGGYQPERDLNSQAVVVVDHSFSVKGVGEVTLGFVRKGIVRKYDKLTLLPASKEVMVRSIQMQDEDFEEAPAGARVGLAIKGAAIDELKRGTVLCGPDGARTTTALKLSFQKSPFYSDIVSEGTYHATVGMQTLPITITGKDDISVAIESEKPIAYLPDDTFLLLDLNAKKMRIIGKGRALQN